MNRETPGALSAPPRWLVRIAWFVALWAGSVAALGVAAELLRLLFHRMLR